jgi:hypothetical protein
MEELLKRCSFSPKKFTDSKEKLGLGGEFPGTSRVNFPRLNLRISAIAD